MEIIIRMPGKRRYGYDGRPLQELQREANAARERGRVERQCPECGEAVPMLSHQLTCGARCRKRAQRRREREDLPKPV